MIDSNQIYGRIIELLDKNSVEYKLFEHRAALTYEDLAQVQKETGFFGSEMKCMVLKAGEEFLVYLTLQGKRVNFDAIKEIVGTNKIRLATPEELKENFGAEPGCAYPFGFDTKYQIYIDSKIFSQDWLLFSPILPTKTIQAKGQDFKKIFDNIENKVEEVDNFNQ